MITAPSRRASRVSSSEPSATGANISLTEQSKSITGKHVLPTVMIPQKQCSRVALPLNDQSPSSVQVNVSKAEENKIYNYPNVFVEAEPKNDADLSKTNDTAEQVPKVSTSHQASSNLRRKKSVPIRRKSTLIDECRTSNNTENNRDSTTFKEAENRTDLNEKLFTRHNGLELLSMVCTTTTAPSKPADKMNAGLQHMQTINSTREQKPINVFNEPMNYTNLSKQEHREEKSTIKSSPIVGMMGTLTAKHSINSPRHINSISEQQMGAIKNKNSEDFHNQVQLQTNHNLGHSKNIPEQQTGVIKNTDFQYCHNQTQLQMNNNVGHNRHISEQQIAAMKSKHIQDYHNQIQMQINNNVEHNKNISEQQIAAIKSKDFQDCYNQLQLIRNNNVGHIKNMSEQQMAAIKNKEFQDYHNQLQYQINSNVQPQVNNNMQSQINPPSAYNNLNVSSLPQINIPQDINNSQVSPRFPVQMQQYDVPNFINGIKGRKPRQTKQLNNEKHSRHQQNYPQALPPPPYNQVHHIIPNMSMNREHSQVNDHRVNNQLQHEIPPSIQKVTSGNQLQYEFPAGFPMNQKAIRGDHLQHEIPTNIQFNQKVVNNNHHEVNVPINQKVPSGNNMNQLLPPLQFSGDTNAHPSNPFVMPPQFQQQNPYLNQFIHPPHDRHTQPIPPPSNIFYPVDRKQNFDVHQQQHQQQQQQQQQQHMNIATHPEFYDQTLRNLLNTRGRQNRQHQQHGHHLHHFHTTSNTKSTKEIDPNQTCTLYYESQNGTGQTECTKTVIYADVPFPQSVPTMNIAQPQQQKPAAVPRFPASKEMPKTSEPNTTLRNLFVDCLQEELANMFGDKTFEINIKACTDKEKNENNQKNPNINVNSPKKLPTSQEQCKSSTPSVIIQNPSVSMSSNQKILNFSHRIENFINTSTTSDNIIQESLNQNSSSIVTSTKASSPAKDSVKNVNEFPMIENLNGANEVQQHLSDQNRCGKTTTNNENTEKLFGVIVEAKAIKVDSRKTHEDSLSTPELSRRLSVNCERKCQNSSIVSDRKKDSNSVSQSEETKRQNEESPPVSENNPNDSQEIIRNTIENKNDKTENDDSNYKVVNNITENKDEIFLYKKITINPGEEDKKYEVQEENQKHKIQNHPEIQTTQTINSKPTEVRLVSLNSVLENPENLSGNISDDKNEDIGSSETCSNVNEVVLVKEESVQNETKDPNFYLNHNFLFDMQFGPSDQVESIFARIMPSCFMILNLIHEMQNMNNSNWWPVDTDGNLLKIKLSLRGISIFLRKSKKLALHLDPYVHHFFLFLLECFGTFRERVRKILDTGYTLKENYISTSEADIYRDVFIQLYDYLCCNRVTDYVNMVTNNKPFLTPKTEDNSENHPTAMRRDSAQSANIQQKHMLIIEKIKQRKIAEEERNENFKNFISHLDHSDQMQTVSKDEEEVDENYEHSNQEDRTQNNTLNDSITIQDLKASEGGCEEKRSIADKDDDDDTTQKKFIAAANTNSKRKIELIVIDSDSDEEGVLDTINLNSEAAFGPLKKQKLNTPKIPHNIASIINIDDDDDDDDVVIQINENDRTAKESCKRKLTEEHTETNKRFCKKEIDQPIQNSFQENQKEIIDSKEALKTNNQGASTAVIIKHNVQNNDEKKIELEVNHYSVDNKADVLETIRKLTLQNDSNDQCVSIGNQRSLENKNSVVIEILDAHEIKKEIKSEREDSVPVLNENMVEMEYNVTKQEKEERRETTDLVFQETSENMNVNIDFPTGNALESEVEENFTKNIPKISIANIKRPSNLENCETIEAIQNFLKETRPEISNDISEKLTTNLEKETAIETRKNDSFTGKTISNPSASIFSTPISHNGENKLVGIATPNVKDADVSSKKNNLQTISRIEEELENEINLEKNMKVKDIPNGTKMSKFISEQIVQKETSKERTIIQKLISFRKPLKKLSNQATEASEENMETNEDNIIHDYPQDVTCAENDPNQVELQENLAYQKEINNNSDDTIKFNVQRIQINATAKVVKESNNAILPDHGDKPINKGKTSHFSPNVDDIQTNHNGLKLTPTESRVAKISVSHPHVHSADINKAYSDKSVNKIYDVTPEEVASVNPQANVAISEYFNAQELISNRRSDPARLDVPVRSSPNQRGIIPVTTSIATTNKNNPILPPPKALRVDSKEQLRLAMAKKHAGYTQRHSSVLPPESQKGGSQSIPTPIPSLQSIYNESVNTNGFISQYIKDEIGILSKKESLGPVEYVEEITTLLRLPLIPKDFKDFYIFVTKQQILQFHQPITFHIFLELLNQSGLKDYHKKFTEYTKRKYEDKVNCKRTDKSRQDHQQLRNTTR